MGKYTPKKIRELFQKWGVDSKIEKDGRVFPTSDCSQDIIDALLNKSNGRLNTKFVHETIKELCYLNGAYQLISEDHQYSAKYLVIATGGSAYRHTGSQ